ncbi:MAG TPA: efflux RND transporter periplasmic adaptor subunit [Gemmatimonadales bacterium]|nr:efflux RND transporter periplasmic adaptor subunit [Gemmatimonadales bacterium]
MTMLRRLLLAAPAAWLLGLPGCRKAESTPPYTKTPVERRDIVVVATASGVIQPILTLSVKSKASGEILEMPVQTGDEVKAGQLLAKIDPRIPQNNLSQAQASLAVAKAQLENATAQLKRSESLHQSQSITDAGLDSARLAAATAQAAVVTAQANLQTAKDAMEDTQVRAPITGTILELDAVLGTVISSPTSDVGGGTVILKMANLDTVQVSALVDETDVGKVQPGMPVTITVDAYPNRTFDGHVLKIEPQAQVSQNVTMFPVDVNILNPEHLLKPGMNTEVEIHVGQRQGVLTVPNAALRTLRDVASAASVLGLDPQAVQQQLAGTQAADAPSTSGGDTADGSKLHAAEATRKGQLPAQIRSRNQPGTSGAAARSGPSDRYIVFALRGGKIVPVPIETGLTDQDHIEVTRGLAERDTVLVLTSAAGR